MAKKSQIRARRNNTKVGSQVVNFYNHGTVNVDARQNNSTSPKSTYSYCTIYHAPQTGRPFTIKDHIEEGHPILGMITPGETSSSTAAASTKASEGNNTVATNKPSVWGSIAAGVVLLTAATYAVVKYFTTK